MIAERGNYLVPDSPAERVAPDGEQAHLVQRILGLLEEGRRSATYKPALLLAPTELAVERARGDAPLTLPLRDIAERDMEVYWPQTRPYPHPRNRSGLLRQGSGRTLRIPDVLARLRRAGLRLDGA